MDFSVDALLRYNKGMLKRIAGLSLTLFAAALLVSCKTIPLSQVDTYGVCKQYAKNLPDSMGDRVAYGILTLGLSELVVAEQATELKKIEKELRRRNLNDCSPNGQATYECSRIYSDRFSEAYQSCVLSNTNSINARIASDKAAEMASAAASAALAAQWSASQAQINAARTPQMQNNVATKPWWAW